MKTTIFIALILALSGTSQAMDLGTAVNTLLAEFRIVFSAMIIDWERHSLQDTESCQVVHDLLRTLPPVFALIDGNDGYQLLRQQVVDAGVAWDPFIFDYLQPAFGLITQRAGHVCSGNTGGANAMVLSIRASFAARRQNIDDTIDTLLVASPDFAALMGRIAAQQATFTALRCTPEALAVGAIYRAAGFDVDAVAVMIGDVFGWTSISPC